MICKLHFVIVSTFLLLGFIAIMFFVLLMFTISFTCNQATMTSIYVAQIAANFMHELLIVIPSFNSLVVEFQQPYYSKIKAYWRTVSNEKAFCQVYL